MRDEGLLYGDCIPFVSVNGEDLSYFVIREDIAGLLRDQVGNALRDWDDLPEGWSDAPWLA